ncbi:hypothetical protein CURTO8I2_70177 [Curtobacterium sp. 8I-2]|nr:hypothetical protein CURTO8I2_70177 [Curtobacterium sp. 8I-2]
MSSYFGRRRVLRQKLISPWCSRTRIWRRVPLTEIIPHVHRRSASGTRRRGRRACTLRVRRAINPLTYTLLVSVGPTGPTGGHTLGCCAQRIHQPQERSQPLATLVRQDHGHPHGS